jgi:hypothetical protein
MNVTAQTYPGAMLNLVTNYGSTTVGTYPGSQPGLATNCVGFTTVTVDPGQQPCLTSNTVVTNITSTAQIPSPPPSGLATNTSPVNNSSTPPSSGTYSGNITTNSTAVNNSPTPPSGYYSNVSTNTTPVNNATTAPAPGTYIGTVTTTGNGSHTKYSYNKISGYNYTQASFNYTKINSYSYPIKYYTYANQLSYTYQIITYTYPQNQYTYVVYTGLLTYQTNSFPDVLSGGNYYTTGQLGNTIVTGNSTLVMPNGFNINGTITIAPGGSLTLYVGGTTFSLSGNQVLNQNGLAQNFIVYCAPTVTSVSFSGNAAFEGVIVAPNATATMNGGGNNAQDFSGAIMANSVRMNGHFNFHYDVALSRVPSPGRFVANSWREIKVP